MNHIENNFILGFNGLSSNMDSIDMFYFENKRFEFKYELYRKIHLL